uniref:RING-type E3 ubiquitin transferase n=1 Tax=Oryza brachyantha TaxID=4533 RepID=J3LGP1_ORYBR
MANDSSFFSRSLLIPLAGGGGCSDDDDDYDEGPSASVSFPSFWPPFPALMSDSDSDVAFPPPHMDRCPPPQGTASAFFGLGFHDENDGDGEWAPPDEEGGEVGLPLCWDCLQLEEHDHQRWDLGANGDGDEWEQVGIRVVEEEEHEEAAASAAVRSLEWEVLLAANSLGGLVVDDADDADGGIDTFFLDDADDVLFGQLAAEAEPPAKGGRAAAKATVEGLPTVVVAEADAARGDAQCAVCKDGIEAGESARRLPCAHLYHDGCILPWLAIRNTCPLCRHELPTDDPEYERWKARRGGGGRGGRYNTIWQLSMIE